MMEHKHQWTVTIWQLVNPYGPCNVPNRYLDLEICRACGMIRVAPHDMERIREGDDE
jgi:hypothetical protein